MQEKNITFQTDAKLYRKIIERVLKLSGREHIKLHRSYTREVKALKVRFMNHPRWMKDGRKAVRSMTGHTPKEALTDRGYRGKKRVGGTEISTPSSGETKFGNIRR